jgi:hypothetical protein
MTYNLMMLTWHAMLQQGLLVVVTPYDSWH